MQDAGERALEIVGIALDDMDARETLAQVPAEFRIVFDQREPGGIDAAREQCFRHRAGAGAELHDRARNAGIDIARHHAR